MKDIFHIMRLRIKNSLIFRSSTLLNFVTSLVLAVVNIFVILNTIFKNTPTLFGWSKAEVIVIQGVMATIGYIFSTFNYESLWRLPFMIEEGYLDIVLLKPMNIKAFVAFNAPEIKRIFNIITGILVLIYGLLKAKPIWTNTPFFLISFVLSYFIYLEINFVLYSISFYLYRAYMLYDIITQLDIFAQYPVSAFGKTLSFIFLTIIPLGVVSNFPAAIILGKESPYKVLFYQFIILLCFYMFLSILWSKGIKRYEGVGT